MYSALDGWSNPKNKSFWSFIIITPGRKSYTYKLCDFSGSSHTGIFLSDQIESIILEIGVEKLSAIVTDGASNVKLARELITTKYPSILNLRCVAHCFNLITKDLMKHEFAKALISKCKKIIKFFKKSHQANHLLDDYIRRLNINGGSLKKYTKTRWTSIYESTTSIIRLQPVFQLVSDVINRNK